MGEPGSGGKGLIEATTELGEALSQYIEEVTFCEPSNSPHDDRVAGPDAGGHLGFGAGCLPRIRSRIPPLDPELDAAPDPEPESEEEGAEVVVCRLQSSSSLTIPIVIGGFSLKAIVDTAAEVTIISDRVLQHLEPQPGKRRDAVLHAAGRNMSMRGSVTGPVSILLGGQEFSEQLYVAPISDDMLLGMDFLHKHRAVIHMHHPRLLLGGVEIPMQHGDNPRQMGVARVYVRKRVTVPPNAVKRVTGVLDQRLQDFVFEPLLNLPAILVPCSLHGAGKSAKVYVINPTDRHLKLTCADVLGEAREYQEEEAIEEVPAGPSVVVSQIKTEGTEGNSSAPNRPLRAVRNPVVGRRAGQAPGIINSVFGGFRSG